MRLSNRNLEQLKQTAEIPVEIPTYDRTQIKAGIVHIGLGNFASAHLAAMVHDLMQSGDLDALNYGIVGVNLKSADRSQALNPQDGLYTVVDMSDNGPSATVIGSVVKTIHAPENPQAIVSQIAAGQTRIVSMTMTPQEHQAYMSADGSINLAHEDIANDLDRANLPRTVYGYIARAFQLRESRNDSVLTIMNLDNMVHNGDVFGKMMLEFIAAYDSSLWAAAKTRLYFPNSMVDRIVPKTTPEFLAQTANWLGIEDMAAISAEPKPTIGLFAVEAGAAGNHRPAFEKLPGVLVVKDVTPYENMKLRLLNASHAAIANLGDLLGYTHIDETMNDPLFQKLMLALMENETGPTLAPVPGINLPAYKKELVARFANTQVKDTTWRVAKDAPLQVVLDAMRDQLADDCNIELLSLATAAWMRRFGVDQNEKGGAIDVAHPLKDVLIAKAKEGGLDPTVMFSITEVFGDIGTHNLVVDRVEHYLRMMMEQGVEAAIKSAIAVSPIAAAQVPTRDAAKHYGQTAAGTQSPAPDGTKSK